MVHTVGMILTIMCPVFQMTKARLRVMEKDHKALKWEHEVLEQRFQKVRTEISALETALVWTQCKPKIKIMIKIENTASQCTRKDEKRKCH